VTTDRPKPRVLIVDDNPLTVDVLARSLARQGYTHLPTAATVPDAIRQLNAGLPDAILLDLGLSLQDGHVLLRHLRRAPLWSPVPVFMVTGQHSASAIKGAAAEGASGFITQPFNGSEIVHKIERAVGEWRSRAAELDDLLQLDPSPSSDGDGERAR